MDHFRYVEGEYFCEGVRLASIARTVGTPTYVYSTRTFTDHLRKLIDALGPLGGGVCYSVKTLCNLAVLRLVAQMGAGADIVSGGELYRARLAGIPADKIVFAGVGKTREEMRYALSEGILLFTVESEPELVRLDAVAREMGVRARAAIRVNPDVAVETHGHIATGRAETKFGVSPATAVRLFSQAERFAGVELCGVHMHIGSQILSLEPYVAALERLLEVIEEARGVGAEIRYLDVGGGLGVIYSDERPATARDFAEAVAPLVRRSGCKLLVEPGRFIAGNAGVLLTRVLYVKETAGKNFVIVDAGMNDLIRPALYGAHHEILSASLRSGSFVADVVGPVCETGDFLARDRQMPRVHEGDLLVVRTAGAYGFVMSSNYNSRPRAAEVLVDGEQFRVVRRRETYQDLVRPELEA